ncbi:MAG: hypothetical protein IPO04_13870 [Cytophagaceae bacterium]|nr:hypothetical protein [Cytophagaceae bacterium]
MCLDSKLHSIGLLSGSFLPDEATEQLRTYCRHRANLLDMVQYSEKAKISEIVKLKADVVVNDICGYWIGNIEAFARRNKT